MISTESDKALPTIAQLEKLYPNVEFTFGVTLIANNCNFPDDSLGPSATVDWVSAIMVGLADRMTSMLNQLYNRNQLCAFFRKIKPDVAAWFSKIDDSADKLPLFAVQLSDDDGYVWVSWSGAAKLYNMTTGELKDSASMVPAEAHLYNLTAIYARMRHRLERTFNTPAK